MNVQELRSELCRQRALGQISQADYEQRLAALDELKRLNLRDSQAPNSLYHLSAVAQPTAARPAPSSPGFKEEPLSDPRMVTQPHARARTPQPLQPGELVGVFRLEEMKAGGEGHVWRAFDTLAQRTVALKMLPPELLEQPDEVERLQEAFRRVQDFHHPHVCPVYVLQQDSRAGMFQVMRFIQGQTLSAYRRAVMKERGSFSLEEVVRVLEPVAQALDAAHARKIVHRDVTPRNIMVDEQSYVWLIDFGLSAEIRSSILRVSQVRMDSSGTAPYMAPEQFRGQLQDGFTDQYALGVVAYEMLSGRVPFEADDMVVLRECVLNEPIPTLVSQPDFVNQAFQRVLAKLRHERFEKCMPFLESLRRTWQSTQPCSVSDCVPSASMNSRLCLTDDGRRFDGSAQPTKVYQVYPGENFDSGSVRALCYSNRQNRLLIGSDIGWRFRSRDSQTPPHKHHISIISLDDWEQIARLKLAVKRLERLSDTRVLVTHVFSGATIFDEVLNRDADTVAAQLHPKCTASVNGENLFLIGTDLGVASVWDANADRIVCTNQVLSHVERFNVNEKPFINCIATSRRAKRFAACGVKCNGVVVGTYDDVTHTLTEMRHIAANAEFLSMSPCGSYVLTHWNWESKIFDPSGNLVKRIPQTRWVHDACWTSSATLLFIATSLGVVQVWSVPDFQLLCELRNGDADSKNAFTAVCINEKTPTIFGGDERRQVIEWGRDAIPSTILQRWK